MPKYLKFSLVIFCVILLLWLFSPILSLFLPEKLANHTYYRLLYHVIVDRETAGCKSPEEKVLKIFQYVIDHEFAQGTPYKCKPAESLIFGEAYCDFQARTLNALLGIVGIPSRYAMLLDKDGISPHTLNEVFLDGKWCVFDPLLSIIFKDEKGSLLSLEELSEKPDLVYNNTKYKVDKDWCSRIFPLPASPRRSTPVIFQVNIFDRALDLYFRLFKYNFFNAYQDLYLRYKKNYSGKEDFRLFFMARNYHLAYRYKLGLKYYQALLKQFPESNFRDDEVFFIDMLYFEMRDLPKAIEAFKLLTDKEHSKWKRAASYYLKRCDELM